MKKVTFTYHGPKPASKAGGVAVRERELSDAANAAVAAPIRVETRPVSKVPSSIEASQHTVSLHGKLSTEKMPPMRKVAPVVMPPRGPLARLIHVLDERIHLHDLRMRTLSIRPRGWKDFPPQGATTLEQAVQMTTSRFFNEHPLAELTVLRALHLVVLSVLYLAQLPGHLFHKRFISQVELPALTKAVARAEAAAVVEEVAPAARALPLRAKIAVWLSPKARAMRYKGPVADAVLREVSVKPHYAEETEPEEALSPVARIWAAPAPTRTLTRKTAPAPVKVAPPAPPKAVPAPVVPAVIEAPAVPAPATVAVPAAQPRVKGPSFFQKINQLTPAWQRGLVGFATVALVLVLPLGVYGSFDNVTALKDRIVSQSLSAVQLMKAAGSAAKNRDFAAASRDFAQADANFSDAHRELGALANVLNASSTLFPGTRIGAAGPLLNAAHEAARAGERLSSGMALADNAEDPAAKLLSLQSYLAAALPHLERASAELGKVSVDAVPANYREQVAEAQAAVPQLTSAVRKATAVTDVMGAILGQSEPRRYLVIFQNNTEIRATGGFMGSFALMDVHKGKVVKMSIPGGGTYDLKGQLSQRVSSPQPLHLINPLWQFQDANWYPDFPTSAKQITWFHEKSGGPTTDGVIAINATLMEGLLKVTGPIEMPEYGKTITSENFYAETQRAVEVEYDKAENKPKQFIADLAPVVLSKLMNGSNDQLLALAAMMDEALSRRDVQLWMRDGEVQDKISALGWGGEVKETTGDFLYVVHTNIAGQKSDAHMYDDLQHSVKILPDGTGIVTLTLTREHRGDKGAQFTGVRNVDFARFYVPQGAMLVEARGFEAPDPKLFKLGDGSELQDAAVYASERSTKVDRESGTRISSEGTKTVFGNWIQTDPGKSSTVTLVYQLPPGSISITRAPEGFIADLYGKIAGNKRDRIDYSLLLQKQSGLNPMTVTSSVDLPRGFSPSWQNPERTRDERGRWTVSATVDRDVFLAGVAEGQ